LLSVFDDYEILVGIGSLKVFVYGLKPLLSFPLSPFWSFCRRNLTNIEIDSRWDFPVHVLFGPVQSHAMITREAELVV
jgi:hypothetical protein